jgi:2-C-methyl-D-erythritol 4-phosphate cytidylyltransferase/2-C-methyl-D-erythritol 2,4-cyclodiphosphate synthase
LHVTVIIAAGGRGQRVGAALPKQLLSVGGRPILERSVTAFLTHPGVDALVVALPQALLDDPPAYLLRTSKPVVLVAGGDRRQDSVANAFRAAGAASDIILIHDAARPFVSADLIARMIAAAADSGAALAAVQARDTVKVALEGSNGDRRRVVKETLPRESVFLAQTPQAFRRDVLQTALDLGARDGLEVTDEAALVERAGLIVRLVEGDASNIKITTPEDLPVAEAIARSAACPRSALDSSRAEGESLALQGESERETIARSADGLAPRGEMEREPFNPRPAGDAGQRAIRTGRAGIGYDLHRLVSGRRLVLGGVTIPSDSGALGHSDADVICHAVTDALLGAACLGDIGLHFPDSDARWRGASSLDLLRRATALVAERGFEVGNVDVTVILEEPRIRDYVDAMRAAVAGALGIDAARVSIKGKTNEGVDAVGRGEAIAAHAVALIRAV